METIEFDAQVLPKIQIQYFSSIRAAVEKFKEEVEIAPNTTLTVYSLLQQLVCIYEKEKKEFRNEIFDKDGKELRDDVTVTVNGTIIKHTNACEINLNPGDTLSLFPIFPGGG